MDDAAVACRHCPRRRALSARETGLESIELAAPDEAERRKRVRRTALVLLLIAAAFYFGFIIMAITRR